MKKISLITIATLISFAFSLSLSAQNAQVTASQGQDVEILLSDFEQEGFWYPSFASEKGNTNIMVFEGKPSAKEVINYQDGTANPNEKVLGLRAWFSQKGRFDLKLIPFSPIQIPGKVRSISIWVSGRQYENKLSVTIKDAKGRAWKLPFEDESGSSSLGFNGWKRMTAIVPDDIKQKEYIYSREPFISITSLNIDFNEKTTELGRDYFIYFDDLTAVTDLYYQFQREDDDLDDNWW